MAVDTAQRRASAIEFGFDLVPLYVPNVGGVTAAGERRQLAHGYNSDDTGDTFSAQPLPHKRPNRTQRILRRAWRWR